MRAIERVNRVMTEPAHFVDVRAPVSEVLHLFESHRFHHLPVVDGPTVVGMLSSSDVLKLGAFIPKQVARPAEYVDGRLRIDQLMRTPPITITGHETVDHAAALMARHGIHALPVIGADGRLVGIITTTDIIDAALRASRRDAGSSGEVTDTASTCTDMSTALMQEAMRSAKDLARADGQLGELARALLQSNCRIRTLETVVNCADRYVRAGQDEHLHAALVRSLEVAGTGSDGAQFRVGL